MRGAVKLSPAAVLLAVLIGEGRPGLIGALTAIPVAAKATVLLVRASSPGTRPTAIPVTKASFRYTTLSRYAGIGDAGIRP